MLTAGRGNENVSLTKSALQGVVWNYFGIAVLVVAQLASTPITARLISPKQFGIYAAATFAIGLAGYLTFATIGAAIQRRSRLGEKTVGSALVISAASATLVLVGLWVFAGAWAELWRSGAKAVPLIRVLALGLFFSSLANVPIGLARRSLRFGVTALAETSTQTAGMVVGVVLAFQMHSAMALAIGQLAAGVSLFGWAIGIGLGEKIRFGYSRSEARELFVYSTQLNLLYISSYAINLIPSWFTSRTFGKRALGLYSRSSLLVTMPLGYLVTGITKVLFPLYGRVRDDVARTRIMLSEGIVLATGFIWPVLAMLAGSSSVVIGLVLGPHFAASVPYLRCSALIACGLFPTSLLTNAAEALGWIRFTAFRLVVLLAMLGSAAGLAKAAGFDLTELLLAVAAAQWITYLITLQPFISRQVVDTRLVIGSHFAHALVSLAAFALSFGAAEALAGPGISWLLVQAAAEIVVFALVIVFIFLARPLFPASRIFADRLARVISPENPWYSRLRLSPAS